MYTHMTKSGSTNGQESRDIWESFQYRIARLHWTEMNERKVDEEPVVVLTSLRLLYPTPTCGMLITFDNKLDEDVQGSNLNN